MRPPVATALLLALSMGTAAAEEPWPGARLVISGADYRVVAAAVPHAMHIGPLDGYAIHIVEYASRYIVCFWDPDRPQGLRGNSPNMVEFEVELDKADLSLIKAHFVR